MKPITLLLITVLLSVAAFSQKKDKFNFSDIATKYKLKDTVAKKFIHADSVAAWAKRTFNFKSAARTEHPKQATQWATYEFYFKDGSILYLQVSPELWVTEITYRYNQQERTSEFITWSAASKKISEPYKM